MINWCFFRVRGEMKCELRGVKRYVENCVMFYKIIYNKNIWYLLKDESF